MDVRGLLHELSPSRAIVAAFLAVGLIAACSSTRESSFGDGKDEKGDAGEEFDPGNTSGDCRECSADLHSVVSCDDHTTVLKTCPDDQACGSGGCVAPCEGAAANKSSIGCDYYAVEPDTWGKTLNSGAAPGSCFAAFVTNNWKTDMKVSLVWKGKSIDAAPYAYIPKGSGASIKYEPIPDEGIPPNSMAIVFLNQWKEGSGTFKVACPKPAAVEDEDVVTHGNGIGKAIEIKTSVPGVVYDVYPFGGATSFVSSATLLLPISVWDTNYVTTTMSTAGPIATFPGGLDFVAHEDGTEVTLLPTADIPAGGGLKPATKNKPVVYKIDKGEIIHLQSTTDLTGSIVQSNKPVGVWGEHFCMVHPDPPKWRIVGAVDDTELTYDPAVTGAPKTIQKGQLVEFNGPGAFHITSQDEKHPFYLAAHRPGEDCDAAHQQIPPVKALGNDYVAVGNEATDYSVGGPETVNVVPPAQFLPSYVFFTDPTYGYTELALTRKKGTDKKFKDVKLDCLGDVDGWQPVGEGGEYEYTHVRLRYGGQAQGKCDNGRHEIKSDVPFGITVWGYDSASSYAYPAGASVRPINQVVVPPSVN